MIGNDWDLALKEEFESDYFKRIEEFIDEEYATRTIYPPKEDIFNAFKFTPLAEVKVVILGQDPYHEEGQAHGLAFSTPEGRPIPRSLKNIFKEIEEVAPELIVIDSIQTMETEDVESAPGSVTQIRECASALLRFAKTSAIPVILIGHINKEGTIAGPKVLEHIVDTVIQFEGDRQNIYRILRSIKNRLGSTSELGIYEMLQNGLRPVTNPSELLLSDERQGMSGIAISAAVEGMRPFLVETQALVSTAAYGTPQRSATGFDQRRLNMLLAVLEKKVGFKLIQKDVFINIAGGLKVTDMAMDLSVIASVFSSNVDIPIEEGWCMCGEVGLSSEVRPVSRIEQRIAEAEKLGFTDIIIPKRNSNALKGKKYSIRIHPVSKVEEAIRTLFS